MITLNFPFTRALAYAMQSEAEDIEGYRFTARPYNQYDSQDSLWWLIPTTDWPAHRHGKIVFTPSTKEPDRVLSGLHVEKGYDRIVKSIPGYIPDNRFLGEGWVWSDFMRDLLNGRVTEAAQTIARRSENSVFMEIEIIRPEDHGNFDPSSYSFRSEQNTTETPKNGIVRYRVDGDAIILEESKNLGNYALKLVTCQHLNELPKNFETNDMRWFWVDIYIGAYVSLARNKPMPETSWINPDIWHSLLHAWMPWVK